MVVYIVLGILLITFIVRVIVFHLSGYYKNTHKLYLNVIFDKGTLGEYRTYKDLCWLEKEGAKFF